MNKTISLLFASLFILYFLFIGSATAQTTNQRTYTVVPPTEAVSLSPGGYKEGTMKFINDSDEVLVFTVEVQDYIVVDTAGTPNLLPPNTLSDKYSAASWIAVYPNSFTIEPHQKQELNYYIQIPPDARPGGHYAAAVYTPSIPKSSGATGAIVNALIGTLFYIDIAGPITENAEITRFLAPFKEYGPVDIQTQIKNLGDLHIRPLGNIVVTNMLGQKTANTLKEQNIFPGGVARDYVNKIGKGFMFGRYEAKLTASYGKNNDKFLVATVAFWVFPWKMAILAVLIIVALVLYFKLLRKGRTKNPPAGGPEDETAN